MQISWELILSMGFSSPRRGQILCGRALLFVIYVKCSTNLTNKQGKKLDLVSDA